ncbi:MAG: hypothetical protein ACJAS1_004619 [Oleiphilaceae bacterium]|jgi:hypothetical protein
MNYWWGFSEKFGWVFLDRTLQCNSTSAKKHLIFVDCQSEEIIKIDYGQWDTFATYEKQIFVMFNEERKEEQLCRLALFKNKQEK